MKCFAIILNLQVRKLIGDKAEDSQPRGRAFEPRHRILDRYYVVYFTSHKPPATLEWHVKHSLYIWEVKNELYFILRLSQDSSFPLNCLQVQQRCIEYSFKISSQTIPKKSLQTIQTNFKDDGKPQKVMKERKR